MSVDLIDLILLSILILFPIFVVIRSKREKKLSELELELSEHTYKMQRYMLEAKVVHGDICHDIIPFVMTYSQFDNKKIPLLRFFRKLDEPAGEFITAFDKELQGTDENVNKLVDKFIDTLSASLFYTQPVVYLICVVFMIAKIIFKKQTSRITNYYSDFKKETTERSLAIHAKEWKERGELVATVS